MFANRVAALFENPPRIRVGRKEVPLAAYDHVARLELYLLHKLYSSENPPDNLGCGFGSGSADMGRGFARVNMTYEPLHERFEVLAPGGTRRGVVFIRSGFLAQGDRPELFFFQIDGEETVVGLSGASLARFELGRLRLSREQKIDLAGRWLKRQMEAGKPLHSGSLYIQDDELANLAIELNFTQ